MLPTASVSAGDGNGKAVAKGISSDKAGADGMRTLFRSRRRVAALLLAVGIAGFLWMQYTMLSSSFFTRPQRARTNQLRHPPKVPKTTATSEQPHVMKETPPLTPAPGELPVSQAQRTRAIKAAMQLAWGSYEAGAFGADEVDPVSGARKDDVWGGIACSLVDALDTLWIMDMKAEFKRARDYVATKLSFAHLGGTGKQISIFETIIREVGGLLSAFDLSGDDVFKHKAQELMDLLVPAFVPSEGVFYTYFNPQTKAKGFASWTQYNALIADVGSLQLETRYLSDITGDPKYAALGEAFYKILQREGAYQDTGLFPVHFDTTEGKFVNQSVFSIGAYGDSFYEYLLKVFIYSGKRSEDAFLREFYDDAVRGIEELLLQFDASVQLYYVQQLRLPHMSGVQDMDHLLCFLPGLLALGTLHEHQDLEKNERHLALAKKIMNTCYQMYHTQATGLAPDVVEFPYMLAKDAKYKLRPETIESLFYMYRVTNDTKYREYGWEIFQNLEKHAKVAHGYGAVLNVRQVPAEVENKMESFFLAETLKYHYLLQASEQLIPLDEYVFNTEAHPLRIRQLKYKKSE